jgi:hypothetical protein
MRTAPYENSLPDQSLTYLALIAMLRLRMGGEKMNLCFALCLALGVFFGNWLFVPLLQQNRTWTDGFFIGLIAAVLVLGINYVISLL